jgi:hypothetical protein
MGVAGRHLDTGMSEHGAGRGQVDISDQQCGRRRMSEIM